MVTISCQMALELAYGHRRLQMKKALEAQAVRKRMSQCKAFSATFNTLPRMGIDLPNGGLVNRTAAGGVIRRYDEVST